MAIATALGFHRTTMAPALDGAVDIVRVRDRGSLGKSATHVYSRLMLLRLQPDIRAAFRRDIITVAHAQRLASVPVDRQPEEAFARCSLNLLGTGAETVDRNNLARMK